MKFIKIICCLIGISCFGKIYAQINLAQGLKLYLPFTGNALDASGNGNNAIVNGATLTTDEFGTANSAYEFDGINDFLEIINNPSLQVSDSISMCAKVYITDFYSGLCQSNCIIQKGDNDFNNGHYSLRFGDAPFDNDCNLFNPNNQTFYGHLKNLGGFPNGTSPGQAGAAPYINLNQWYCLVYTWDGDSIKMYVDGVLRWKYFYFNQPNGTNTNNLFLGKRNNTTYPFYFKGKMDEVRLYNRALKANEVAAYCAGCNYVNSISSLISTTTNSICANGTLTINASASIPYNSTYQWYSINNTSIASTANNIVVNPTNNSSYALIVTDSNGCIAADTITITINNATPIVINAATNTICAGIPTTLTSTGSGTITWAPAATISSSTSFITAALPITNTIYTATVVNANGCTATNTIAINVQVAPTLSIPTTSYTTCVNNNIQLSATTNANNIVWLPTIGLNNNIIANPIATITTNTIYTVSASTGSACNPITGTIAITANSPLPLIINGATDTICKGAIINLSIAPTFNTITWAPSANFTNPNSASTVLNNTLGSIYTLQATDANNCIANTTFIINMHPAINLQVTGDNFFCKGDSVQLVAYGASTYTWSPMTFANTVSNNSIKIYPNANETYFVKAKDDFGCTDSTTYNITIQDPPIVTITKSNDIICNKNTATLIATNADAYNWVTDASLSTTIGSTVLASPISPTTYTVIATKGECTVTATILVNVIATTETRFYAPNAISPNNDGVNDEFKVITKGPVNNFYLIIFNRWGEKVFEATDVNKPFLGVYNGRLSAVNDSFFYLLKFTDDCGTVEQKGDIIVLR
jgi:gliding motility-associated-like protein